MSACIRHDTLAGLATASIPPGTESVVVERFDQDSAASAALYIPVGSNPGHDLSVLNAPSGSWWAVHPDHLWLEAAGAPANVSGDCAGAMQRVLGYLAAVGRAKLQLKERDYVFKPRATLAQSSGDPPLSFTIEGRSRNASRLLVQHPDNVAGAFALNFADNQSEFVARDFSVIATGAAGPNASCGTAIVAEFADRTDAGCGAARDVAITNVLVGGADMITEGDSRPFFAVGIDITGARHPFISGCMFASPMALNEAGP